MIESKKVILITHPSELNIPSPKNPRLNYKKVHLFHNDRNLHIMRIRAAK